MPVNFSPSQEDPNTEISPLPYTSSPLQLLRFDMKLAFQNLLLVPTLLLPMGPFSSGDLDELSPSWSNLKTIGLHTILGIVQVAFLVTLPLTLFHPLGLVLAYVGLFMCLNFVSSRVLNGTKKLLFSNVKVPRLPEHEHERWILVNGVAVGHHWLQSNLNRLALAFRREVLGVHNPTYGVVFDLIQCLLERCFVYATDDIRSGYALVRESLQDEKYKKVILILHSQGGINGGLMIDWLLADFPDILFQKLEVYTFANAANHFNNPVYNHAPDSVRSKNAASALSKGQAMRAIRHVEHYANTKDFVTQFGVLHFTHSSEYRQSRFVGRVFEYKEGAGHQLNLHYLNHMFPYDMTTGRVPDTSAFMETLVDIDDNVIIDRESPAPPRPENRGTTTREDERSNVVSMLESEARLVQQKPVRELSRLWQYRNGQSPED